MGISNFDAQEAGLEVYSNAYDATSGENAMTSIETFQTNVLALYDVESGEYVTPEGVDLEDVAAVKKWVEENGGSERFAVLFGESMENADGFMSIDGYIKAFGEKGDVNQKTQNDENDLADQNGSATQNGVSDYSEKIKALNNMGFEHTETPYDDGSVVIKAVEGDTTNYYRFDENGNMTNSRGVAADGTETVTMYGADGNGHVVNITSDMRSKGYNDLGKYPEGATLESSSDFVGNVFRVVHFKEDDCDVWLTYKNGSLVDSRVRPSGGAEDGSNDAYFNYES